MVAAVEKSLKLLSDKLAEQYVSHSALFPAFLLSVSFIVFLFVWRSRGKIIGTVPCYVVHSDIQVHMSSFYSCRFSFRFL